MEKVSTYFVPQRDPLFRKGEQLGLDKGLKKGLKQGLKTGIEKGIEESKLDFVSNLLRLTDFSDEKIALLAEVEVTLVTKMRQQLQAKPERAAKPTRTRAVKKAADKK